MLSTAMLVVMLGPVDTIDVKRATALVVKAAVAEAEERVPAIRRAGNLHVNVPSFAAAAGDRDAVHRAQWQEVARGWDPRARTGGATGRLTTADATVMATAIERSDTALVATIWIGWGDRDGGGGGAIEIIVRVATGPDGLRVVEVKRGAIT